MQYKVWIYHATKKPKIISSEQIEAFEAEGWVDSPARFINLETLGINKAKTDAGDEEETAKAQQALDMVDGITASLNKKLNLNQMGKQELEDYAKEHYGVDIDRRKSVKALRKEVKALTEA
jgi:hypothetical protein